MAKKKKRFRRWLWWQVCYYVPKGQWLYWKWGWKAVRDDEVQDA